jgi:hypothetical protein
MVGAVEVGKDDDDEEVDDAKQRTQSPSSKTDTPSSGLRGVKEVTTVRIGDFVGGVAVENGCNMVCTVRTSESEFG